MAQIPRALFERAVPRGASSIRARTLQLIRARKRQIIARLANRRFLLLSIVPRNMGLTVPNHKKAGLAVPEWERTNAMRMSSCLLRLSWLVPAALMLGLGAEAHAQDAHAGMKMPAATEAPPWLTQAFKRSSSAAGASRCFSSSSLP